MESTKNLVTCAARTSDASVLHIASDIKYRSICHVRTLWYQLRLAHTSDRGNDILSESYSIENVDPTLQTRSVTYLHF